MNLFEKWNIPCMPVSGSADKVMQLFLQAQEEGRAQGYVPVIYMETDGDMLESACDDALFEYGSLEAFAEDVRTVCAETNVTAYRCDEWERIRVDTEAGLFDDIEDGETEDGFALEGAKRLYLLKVPAEQPWQVFEKIPFGGFGCCPENGVHMAFARRWYETCGAVPALISDCCVQYLLPECAEAAPALNTELLNYCPSLTEYIHPQKFAEQFAQVRVWFFFWDEM